MHIKKSLGNISFRTYITGVDSLMQILVGVFVPKRCNVVRIKKIHWRYVLTEVSSR